MKKTTESAAAGSGGNSKMHNTLVYFRQHWQLYVIFMLPAFLLTIIFRYIPMGGIMIAFTEYNPIRGIFGSEWVGLAHFRRFLSSPDFMRYLVNTLKLIDEGNTIPFIARYRKEATGSLNDEVLRNLDERLKYLRGLEERKAQVLSSIEEQGKLTADLKKKIEDAQTMVAVEDLYLPYRPKRKTRAGMAKEKGLEPLADLIMLQMVKSPLETEAKTYVSEEKGVANEKAAIDGAKDILAERIAEDAKYRTYIRKVTFAEGLISSEAKDEKSESVYEMYYHYEEPVKKCAGHRVLALNRGEKEKILTVKITAPEETILRYLEKQVIIRDNLDRPGDRKRSAK